MMVALLLYAYARGERSSRGIERRCVEDVAYRVIAAQQTPDHAAGALGPAVSGVLTPFPVAASVLAAFTLAHNGPAASVTMLRGFVTALPGFTVFFFAVAVALG
jgi:hypothetical protein